jgi:hypothetical protein
MFTVLGDGAGTCAGASLVGGVLCARKELAPLNKLRDRLGVVSEPVVTSLLSLNSMVFPKHVDRRMFFRKTATRAETVVTMVVDMRVIVSGSKTLYTIG